MTKYENIAKDIKFKIENGAYTENQMLPAGNVLAADYGCSVLTVSKALNKLTHEGYIIRKKGAGTFVKQRHNSTTDRISYRHLLGSVKIKGKENVKSHVLNFEIVKADSKIASLLNISEHDFVYEITRVREVSGRRTVIEYTYIVLNEVPGLNMTHLNNSVYGYIRDSLKINLNSAHIFIRSAIPTELELDNLDFDDSKFLIEVESTAFSDTGVAVEHSIARHVHDTFVFEDDYTL